MSPDFSDGPVRRRPQPSSPSRLSPDRAARALLLSSVAIAAVASTSGAARGEVLGLGFLPGYDKNSSAFGISADGTTVVGRSEDAGASGVAFRWTEAGGMTLLAPSYSTALAASGDGSAVVGYFQNGDHPEAFRWTAAGLQALGTGGYTGSHAFGISDNGNYVVGQLYSNGVTQAFAWTEAGGIRPLGYFMGGTLSGRAFDVSDNGIVVGLSRMVSGQSQAFYKDLAVSGPIQGLGYLSGGTYSFANAITPNASFIVGASTDATNSVKAVRWSANAGGYDGPVALDGGGGWYYSEATGVSIDGSVIVGSYKLNIGDIDYHAFRWAEGGSMQSLDQWLKDSGVDTTGWTLTNASAVSGDGGTIVGSGHFGSSSYQAYIARAGLLVGTIDYSESVASLRDVSRLTSSLSIAWATDGLPKASGLPGLSVSGVYSHADGSSSDLGGATLTWRQPGFAVSAGGGVVSARTSPLYQGGSARLSGAWIGGGMIADIGETFDFPAVAGLEVSVGARADLLKATIARNYLNGAVVQTATGETGATSFTTAARVAWRRDLTPAARLTPYAQWLHNSAALDAYAETGGGGAGTVSKQSVGADIVSVGASFDWQVRPGLELTASYAFNHMIDPKGAAVSVAVPGLGTFGAQGVGYTSTWHTIGAGIAWNPSPNVQFGTSVSVNLGSAFPENWTIGSKLSVGL